ncbi:NAD(P)H-binding protein [Streptomyces sp. NRRL B-24572]|uniref:NAD(P)H-binding protein n=1 Tax=Streptomyces sp. NRRL B-24572 TaxID=1962156 RepID=UPI0015C5155C|nr:NAD(P)H-binding protein [Streptomyces sp. NRRL B-24572]
MRVQTAAAVRGKRKARVNAVDPGVIITHWPWTSCPVHAASGHTTRALVRDAAKAERQLPAEARVTVADVTRPDTLAQAVADVDAVLLTLGSDGTGHSSPENADYAESATSWPPWRGGSPASC